MTQNADKTAILTILDHNYGNYENLVDGGVSVVKVAVDDNHPIRVGDVAVSP